MIARRTGFIAGVALAVGLAIGLAGTALAANPTASSGYPSMMGGRRMMGGVTQVQRQRMLERCEQILDGSEASPSPSATASAR